MALRLIVALSDRTICVTEAERDEIARIVGPRGAGKLVTVHNGIEPPTPAPTGERERVRAELGLRNGVTALLYVGRLEERKDPLTAVRAVLAARSEGAEVKLFLAGDGPLEAEIAAAGRDGIVPLGRREDVGRLLAAADVVVLPSRREGLPYALLEAMAYGLPVVASDIPGNAEAVGPAGVLVPPGDVSGFAAAFTTLVSDAEERGRLGALAERRIEERFGAEAMIASTRDVYEQVLRL